MADHVDGILDQWRRERPDLDCSPMGVIGRVHRLADVLDGELRPVFAAAGLGDGDFDVLATLRRAGDPFELTPGEIAATSMVTSGAVTKRVDRLAAAGLVSRTVCADDARSRRVRLTPSGLDLIERLVTEHVANEHRLLACFDDAERATLAGLLRRWSLALDLPDAPADAPEPG